MVESSSATPPPESDSSTPDPVDASGAAAATPTAPDPPLPLHRRINVPLALSLTLAAALLIAMGELNRLSAAALDPQGRSWPFDQLMGPGRVFDHDPAGWSATSSVPQLNDWLRAYLFLDIAFIAIYTLGGFRWLYPRKLGGAVLVVATGLVDLLEDVLALLVGRPTSSTDTGVVATVLPWVSFAKWLLFIVLAVVLLRRTLTPAIELDAVGNDWVEKFLVRAGSRWPLLKHALQWLPSWKTKAALRCTPWLPGLRTWARAAWTQRFSLLPLLPLVFLSLLPGPNMADQIPDVQRRWADGAGEASHAVWATLALLVLGVAMFYLGRLRTTFVARLIGQDPSTREAPILWIWVVGPLLVALAALTLSLTGAASSAGLNKTRMAVFIGLPVLLVWLPSAVIAHLVTRTPTTRAEKWVAKHVRRPRKLALTPDHVGPILVIGDLAACLGLVVGALGLVRSFTAVVALHPAAGRGWLFLAVGAASALVVWPLGALLIPEFTGPTDADAESDADTYTATTATPTTTTTTTTTDRDTSSWVPSIAMMIFCAALLLVIGSQPWWFAAHAGVVASLTLALLGITGLAGSLAALMQPGGAPYVFWLPVIRLRAAPVITLLLVAMLWASNAGGNVDVHGVRGLTPNIATAKDERTKDELGKVATAIAARPTIQEAFNSYLKATDLPTTTTSPATTTPATNTTSTTSTTGSSSASYGCFTEKTIGDHTYRLRPLLLVAAEGGGVRAAYWAAAGMQLLSGHAVDDTVRTDTEDTTWTAPTTADARCGAYSTLFASGASGGSVGLTVAELTPPDSTGATARDQVVAMAAPEGLGAAAIGLTIRDLIYASVGIPLTAEYGATPSTEKWFDRAGLLERSWESSAPVLAQPFLPYDPTTAPPRQPWHLVFGSTSMTTGCRELVSQLTLATAPAATDTNGQCSQSDRFAAQTGDLLADYSPSQTTPATDRPDSAPEQHCLGKLTAATASMLSGRFPYVTPSGVVGPCGPQPTQQLVDGGYTENTGLGTIVDLSSQWLPLVQRHNDTELSSPAKIREIVVPVIVYFDNGTGSDLIAPSRSITNELLVPPVGKSRAGFAQADAPALLQRAATLAQSTSLWAGSDSPEETALISTLTDAIDTWRPHPVAVVHQTTEPAVTAPLGWVLSKQSIQTMDHSLAEQTHRRCSPATSTDALCHNGFIGLGDVRDLLTVSRGPATAP